MSSIRKQLTLFIDQENSKEIEKIRKEFNPVQYELIPAHVTLCREDELYEIDKVIQQIRDLQPGYIAIDFGPAERFADAKGVLLPGKGKNIRFHNLHSLILQNNKIRDPLPHITLMHPRNSTCNDLIFKKIAAIKFPDSIIFNKISLIEQEADKRWNILQEFELKGNFNSLPDAAY